MYKLSICWYMFLAIFKNTKGCLENEENEENGENEENL